MGDNTSRSEEDIKRKHDEILECAEITHRNRKYILRFYDRLTDRVENGEMGESNFLRRLSHLHKIALADFDLSPLLVSLRADESHGLHTAQKRAESEAEAISNWINNQEVADSTKDDWATSIRAFVNTFASYSRIPRHSDYLKTNRYDPETAVPEPNELLTWEDHILPGILEKWKSNFRDPAIYSLQWGSGGRPQSELHKLTMNQIEIRENCTILYLPTPSKTGNRTVKVYVGINFVKDWLRKHPRADMHDDSDTRLWVSLQGDRQPITYERYKNICIGLSEVTDVDRPTNPRMWRKSRASIAAYRDGMNESELRQIFGWSRDSNMPDPYISKYGEQASDKLAEIEGADADETGRKKSIAPVQCPRDSCGRYTPRFLDDCFYCGTAIDPEAGTSAEEASIDLDAEVDELWTKLVKMATTGELSTEDAEFAEMISTVARRHPGMTDELTDLIETLNDADS